jgi:ABC-2 type transport system permease protein
MHNILMIIRREYRERVTKKSFWIGTLVFPVLMLGLVGSSIFFMSMQMAKQRHLAFVDATGVVAQPAAAKLSEGKLKDGSPMWVVEVVPVQGSVEETRKALSPRVLSKELYGVVTIGPDIDSDENFRFYGMNVSDIGATMEIRGALTDSVVAQRLQKSQLAIDQKALEALTKRVDLETFQESAAGGATKKGFEQAFFATFGFVILMFMSLLLYGIAMLRGVLEEKTTRVMEVLLGSVSPNELMAGKILGIGLVGLTQMVIYMGTVGLLRVYILAKMGGGGFGWVQDALSPMKLVFFVVFFLLGYFFYTALFAAVGAVCNSEQEAQNLQQPLTMMLMIPYIMTFFFVKNSDHMAAVIMSLIPPFTPMIMFTRLSAGTVPAWQLLLGIVLLVGSTVLVFRGAAKIFRIGILMYGKRPTIPEILRWARS